MESQKPPRCLADIFENCKEIYDSDKLQFLSKLEKHIDLDLIVPISFRNHFYASITSRIAFVFLITTFPLGQ